MVGGEVWSTSPKYVLHFAQRGRGVRWRSRHGPLFGFVAMNLLAGFGNGFDLACTRFACDIVTWLGATSSMMISRGTDHTKREKNQS